MKRREQIVRYLNDKFQSVLKEKKTILATYSEIVHTSPYRVLASYSYNWEEKPFRSARVADDPALTETCSDVESNLESSSQVASVHLPEQLRNLSPCPQHNEFIQLVINAKTMADLDNIPTPFIWRGYNTLIEPGFIINEDNVKKKLHIALKNISSISSLEKQVYIYIYIYV